MAYIDQIIYDAGGHTGNVYYVRFVVTGSAPEVKQIWDNVNEELAVSPTWENSAIELIEVGLTGAFPIVTPEDLPEGKRYDVIVYKQLGSVPHYTDDVEKQYELKHGSIFGF